MIKVISSTFAIFFCTLLMETLVLLFTNAGTFGEQYFSEYAKISYWVLHTFMSAFLVGGAFCGIIRTLKE